MNKFVSAGDVYTVNLGEPFGCEQGGIRPCIVVSNAKCCAFSDLIYIIPITSQNKINLPEHYVLFQSDYPFLTYVSNTALGEQCRPIDKSRLGQKIGKIFPADLCNIVNNMKKNFIV